MKLEQSELSMMKQLILNKKSNPNDVWAKESLNQYMEDISHKYKIKLSTHSFNLDTGEIFAN